MGTKPKQGNEADLPDEFKAQEDKADLAEYEAGTQENQKKTKVFWAPAKLFQLGNFKEEERYLNGKIKSREVPLRFQGNMYITEKQDEIDFILQSDAFEAGVIKECADVAEATALNAAQGQMRTVMTITSEINESVEIKDKAL